MNDMLSLLLFGSEHNLLLEFTVYRLVASARRLAIVVRTARARHNEQYRRQGGAALYCLYLLKEGRIKAEEGCLSCLCGLWCKKRSAVRWVAYPQRLCYVLLACTCCCTGSLFVIHVVCMYPLPLSTCIRSVPAA
jgi:hypothetical protein